MADDAEPDFSSLPLVERAVHKMWKVRKEAYEEAAKCVLYRYHTSADVFPSPTRTSANQLVDSLLYPQMRPTLALHRG